MIEAVNSVLSNSPLTRIATESQSVVNSFAANPDRVQVVAQAPYISPYIHVDVNFDKAVLQIRDSDTGDVVRTIPSEGQLEAYRRAQSTQSLALNRPEPEEPAPQQRAEASVVSAPEPQTRVQVSAPAPQQQAATPIQAAAAQVAPTTISIDTQA